MPSPFATALAQMDVDLDAHLGEEVSLIPMIAGDYDQSADPARQEVNVIALVNFVDPSSADISTLDARVRYEEVEIEVDRSLLPTDPGWILKKQDEVVLLERPSSPRYKIGRVDTIDPVRLYITLSKTEN